MYFYPHQQTKPLHKREKPHHPSGEMTQLIKRKGQEGGLFLSGVEAADNQQLLKKHDIRAILTIGYELQYLNFHGVAHKILPVQDVSSENIQLYFTEAINFIDEQRDLGNNVLVHCYVGVSRSVTIAIAYLMWRQSYNLREAFIKIQELRPKINPNEGFLNQLVEFQKKIKGILEQPQPQSLKHSQSQISYTPKFQQMATSRIHPFSYMRFPYGYK